MNVTKAQDMLAARNDLDALLIAWRAKGHDTADMIDAMLHYVRQYQERMR